MTQDPAVTKTNKRRAMLRAQRAQVARCWRRYDVIEGVLAPFIYPERTKTLRKLGALLMESGIKPVRGERWQPGTITQMVKRLQRRQYRKTKAAEAAQRKAQRKSAAEQARLIAQARATDTVQP